jgi:hypothetical protein
MLCKHLNRRQLHQNFTLDDKVSKKVLVFIILLYKENSVIFKHSEENRSFILKIQPFE